MKKIKNLFYYSGIFALAQLLTVIFVAAGTSSHSIYIFFGITAVLFVAWLSGCAVIVFKKRSFRKLSGVLLRLTGRFAIFTVICLLLLQFICANYPYNGGFSMETPVWKDKNVMVIVPHQDDDINLVGGMIEPYVENGSDVTVVFTTNGDNEGLAEVRANEVIEALTPLGIQKENIYYLGFGDSWTPQTGENGEIPHIYLSPDGDALWTSHYGATATYGTAAIEQYMDLEYTRNNYLFSLKSLILEKKPEIIFAVDFDHHLDHKATSLFFEEAMGQILAQNPDYRPNVYKGFCYGTAWEAPEDFYESRNLLSSKKPEESTWNESAFAYRWEDRIRFPIGKQNLNSILSNNSVFTSFDSYRSAHANQFAAKVLNGDKVFWERRTDSMLYNAEIKVNGQQTTLLNDFKLVDFQMLNWFMDLSDRYGFCSAVSCGEGQTVRVQLQDTVTANMLYLYDHPDLESNILGGVITFSDGSTIELPELEKDGSVTAVPFSQKQIDWLEITVTEAEGSRPGLTETELYFDTVTDTESFLMAVDQDDNFVYDYVLQEEETLVLDLYQFPNGKLLNWDEVSILFEATGKESGYSLENGQLVIRCAPSEDCAVAITKDGAGTTFTVSNPSMAERYLVQLLRKVDETSISCKFLLSSVVEVIEYKLEGIF